MAGAKVAICVTSGMCMRSHVVTGVKTFGSPPREHKYINVVMHNQDWERWAAFMCLCFGQQLLYANITDLAIQFGTMMSKTDDANACESILFSLLMLTWLSSECDRRKHPPRSYESHQICNGFALKTSLRSSREIRSSFPRYWCAVFTVNLKYD
jgi:hypothetical protein